MASLKADPLAKVKGSSVAVRVQELQAAAASETGGVQIVRPATVPSAPASRKLLTHIVVGLIAALVLAAASVLGLEAVDHRLRGSLEFEAAFGAPVLGTIPGGRRLDNPMRLQAARRRAYTDLAARLAFTAADRIKGAVSEAYYSTEVGLKELGWDGSIAFAPPSICG